MEFMKFNKTVMKNLFKKPVTTMYPQVPKVFYEGTRGHIRIEMDKCILCGICSKRCPSNAIDIKKDLKEWRINRMKCIQCNACVEQCPKKCLFMEKEYTNPNSKEISEHYHA